MAMSLFILHFSYFPSYKSFPIYLIPQIELSSHYYLYIYLVHFHKHSLLLQFLIYSSRSVCVVLVLYWCCIWCDVDSIVMFLNHVSPSPSFTSLLSPLPRFPSPYFTSLPSPPSSPFPPKLVMKSEY